MANENWLGGIDNSKFLYDIVMPGSHDAGVYRDSTVTGSGGAHKDVSPVGKAKDYQVRCQSQSIFDQAMSGSRFFDCRVYLRSFPIKKVVDGKVVSEQKVPTLGHFAVDTKEGALGGYGGSLVTVVRDAISFVRSHQSEFIILRFSHTKCTDEVADALEALYDSNGNDQYIFNDAVNIAQARIASLRGKVIMVFDSKFNKQRLDSHQIKQGRGLGSKGMHLFSKYSDGKPAPNGLCTCGSFASSDKMEAVKSASIEGAKKHRDHVGGTPDHLCFIYWQLTATTTQAVMGKGNVEAVTTGATGTHAQLPDFLLDLLENVGNNLPNVISHDFVNDDTCSAIIRLNTDRKLMMAEAIARQRNR